MENSYRVRKTEKDSIDYETYLKAVRKNGRKRQIPSSERISTGALLLCLLGGIFLQIVIFKAFQIHLKHYEMAVRILAAFFFGAFFYALLNGARWISRETDET